MYINGENGFFSKWCWAKQMTIQTKIKLDYDLLPHGKVDYNYLQNKGQGLNGKNNNRKGRWVEFSGKQGYLKTSEIPSVRQTFYESDYIKINSFYSENT